MCGIPYHSSDAYIARLIAKGYKVAICEQTVSSSAMSPAAHWMRTLSAVTDSRRAVKISNSGAKMCIRDRDYPRDTFRHEQDLLVTENGKTALFAGCAHCGIVNILKSAEDAVSYTHLPVPRRRARPPPARRTCPRSTPRCTRAAARVSRSRPSAPCTTT